VKPAKGLLFCFQKETIKKKVTETKMLQTGTHYREDKIKDQIKVVIWLHFQRDLNISR
jgi:hypothetical protein